MKKENTELNEGLKKVEKAILGNTADQQQETESKEENPKDITSRVSSITDKVNAITQEKTAMENTIVNINKIIGVSDDSSKPGEDGKSKPSLEEKMKMQQERLARIIKDLRKKNDSLKRHKNITEAGIKRLERQIFGDIELPPPKDDDDRYNRMTDKIKEYQKSIKKFNNSFSLIQSNVLPQNETSAQTKDQIDPNPVPIVQAFRDMKKEISTLNEKIKRFENSNGTQSRSVTIQEEKDENVIKVDAKTMEMIKQLKEKNEKLEKETNNYQTAFSQIEKLIIQQPSDNESFESRVDALTHSIKERESAQKSSQESLSQLSDENKQLNDENNGISTSYS